MQALSQKKRKHYSDMLKTHSQSLVISQISQFFEADVIPFSTETGAERNKLNVLVFNMERGIHLEEIKDYLKNNPDIQPLDLIFANELDIGCLRSGNKNTAREIAEFLEFNYVYGLEFIELANSKDPKGFHGNAIFSRWPLENSKILRLPEKFNWYFDQQTRIGGRNAIFATLNMGNRKIGLVCTHLENRTDSDGRRAQMSFILNEAEKNFSNIPIIIGGDFNTNGFKHEDIDKMIHFLQNHPIESWLKDIPSYEPLLQDAANQGYLRAPQTLGYSRRKPLLDGSYLPLMLDWILVRDLQIVSSNIISTETKDFNFINKGSCLAQFDKSELSDHNVIQASLIFP